MADTSCYIIDPVELDCGIVGPGRQQSRVANMTVSTFRRPLARCEVHDVSGNEGCPGVDSNIAGGVPELLIGNLISFRVEYNLGKGGKQLRLGGLGGSPPNPPSLSFQAFSAAFLPKSFGRLAASDTQIGVAVGVRRQIPALRIPSSARRTSGTQADRLHGPA